MCTFQILLIIHVCLRKKPCTAPRTARLQLQYQTLAFLTQGLKLKWENFPGTVPAAFALGLYFLSYQNFTAPNIWPNSRTQSLATEPFGCGHEGLYCPWGSLLFMAFSLCKSEQQACLNGWAFPQEHSAGKCYKAL